MNQSLTRGPLRMVAATLGLAVAMAGFAGTAAHARPLVATAAAADPSPSDRAALNKKCTPEVIVRFEDSTSESARAIEDTYPEPTLQILAQGVCEVLYTKAAQVRTPEVVVLRVLDRPGGAPSAASGFGNRTGKIAVNTDYLDGFTALELLDEFKGIVTHELARLYAKTGEGASTGLRSGLADYVRYEAGYKPANAEATTVGEWDQGGSATAFFLQWLDTQKPGIVRAMNLSIGAGGFDIDTFFPAETGKTVDQLWKAYIAS